MRILGATLLILGFAICFAIEDGEFFGLVPTAIGVVLLIIAEKRQSDLALAQAAFIAETEKQAPRLTQKQLPTAEKIELNSEVLELLERLNRTSKLR
jgi:multisubunit Na+/H+ antiporter MnhG subunit